MVNKVEQSIKLDMAKITPEGKFNFAEAVAEAQVNRIIAEEQELEQADTEIAKLKKSTMNLFVGIANLGEDQESERREIRNEIVVMNMRLVTQVIKKYGYFSPDKFQNGCIGLLKAADTYKLEREVPFANYAAMCIETEIRLAWKKQTRAFESRVHGYLDSIDEPMSLGNGDTLDRGEMIEDELSSEDFSGIIEEAGLDTIVYDIVLPCIEEYGTRSGGIDLAMWRDLQLQYFLEMAVEDSRLKRLTFTEMAKQLGTTPQNLRVRHKKVVELVKVECERYGFMVGEYGGVYYADPVSGYETKAARRKRKSNKFYEPSF